MSLETALIRSVLGTVLIVSASVVICKAADTYAILKGVLPVDKPPRKEDHHS